MTARELLAFVFEQARGTLGHSPEQIGNALGMSGRTVRRLEDPADPQRPRRSTLQTLATFYGLDARFITLLSEWNDLGGVEVAERLSEAGDGDEIQPDDGPLRVAALRLARGAGTTRGAADGPVAAIIARGDETMAALLNAYAELDRRRQRLLLLMAQEMAGAQTAEVLAESRDRHGHGDAAP